MVVLFVIYHGVYKQSLSIIPINAYQLFNLYIGILLREYGNNLDNFWWKNLLCNGYMYIKDKDSADTTYSRCEKRGICISRMITYRSNDSVKKSPSNHNNASDIASVEAVKLYGDNIASHSN